jgi:hypothetical protein
MADATPAQLRLVAEGVALLAEAAGIPIAAERLPDVTAVLTELFALEAALDELELAGIDPNMDDAQWLNHGQ